MLTEQIIYSIILALHNIALVVTLLPLFTTAIL
jgi:hypothetical protein